MKINIFFFIVNRNSLVKNVSVLDSNNTDIYLQNICLQITT